MIVRREEAVLELAKWILRDLENSSAGAGRAGAMARAVAGKLGVNADLRAEHYLTLTAQEAYVANAINSYVEVRKALASLTPTDIWGENYRNETPWNDSHVRIRKGVTPYGGRTMAVQGFKRFSNGRVEVELIADTAANHKNPAMGRDVRIYSGHEVEGLSAKRLKVLQERQDD